MASPDTPEPRDLVAMLRTGDAPRDLRQFAARGLLPLDGDGQMRALLAVANDEDEGILDAALERLMATPPQEFSRFLGQASPTSMEIDVIARKSEDPQVLEQIIRHKTVADETLEMLAGTVTGSAQEALVINQVRLLAHPVLIDALFNNPGLTADGRRRLNEIREEFFDKEERREADRKRRAEEIAAGTVPLNLTPEEQAEVDAAKAEEGGQGSLTDEEFKTLVTEGAIHRRITTMTVSEKIKLAYSGGKEERRILIGDANKLVGLAVLKSRGITLPEIESICMMRHVSDEIFRTILGRREWARRQAIALALVKNPKVPIAMTLPLVKQIPLRELRNISRDPNLAEGLRIMSRKTLVEKRR